jgi:AraC family transcriptional regulator
MTDHSVVFLPPCALVFVRASGPYPTSSSAAWSTLLAWLSDAGHTAPDHVGFGLALDDPRTTPAEQLRYDACVKRPATFSDRDLGGVSLQHFQGGAYYRFLHTGAYGLLGRAVSDARNVLLPREGLVHDPQRAVLTLNYSYPDSTPPEEQRAEICLPVLPNRRLWPRVPDELSPKGTA